MIREIKNSDRQIIYQVLQEQFQVTYKADTPFTKWYIYEKENDIIGFINIDIIYEKAEIEYIYVKKEYRRQNIATQLLKEIEQKLENEKVESITLEVNVNNLSAIRFYEKNNFKKIHIRKQYYGNIDAFLMLKELVMK